MRQATIQRRPRKTADLPPEPGEIAEETKEQEQEQEEEEPKRFQFEVRRDVAIRVRRLAAQEGLASVTALIIRAISLYEVVVPALKNGARLKLVYENHEDNIVLVW